MLLGRIGDASLPDFVVQRAVSQMSRYGCRFLQECPVSLEIGIEFETLRHLLLLRELSGAGGRHCKYNIVEMHLAGPVLAEPNLQGSSRESRRGARVGDGPGEKSSGRRVG